MVLLHGLALVDESMVTPRGAGHNGVHHHDHIIMLIDITGDYFALLVSFGPTWLIAQRRRGLTRLSKRLIGQLWPVNVFKSLAWLTGLSYCAVVLTISLGCRP